jgi:hypothetical protein
MGEVVKSGEQTAAGDRVLALIRTKFPSYHPLLAIAELAHSERAKDDARLQLECHKTLVKYVTPELKSIEVKADIRETRRVVVSMFDGGPIDMSEPELISYDQPQVRAEREDPLWKALGFLEEAA